MSILFLLRLWPVYGGGETVTICLANEMVKRGWHVSVAYFKKSIKENLLEISPQVNSFEIENVECDEFSASMDYAPKVQNTIISYIKSNNIDVVINQWWPSYYIDRLKAETGAYVVTCLHQAFYTPILDDKGLKNRLKLYFYSVYEWYKKKKAVNSVKEYLPYVDKYIYLSNSLQKQFQKFAHYDNTKNKLASIPNPLVYSIDFAKEEISNKENMVLLVGRMLEGQKRITKAIKIWSAIEDDSSLEGWNFCVVGEGPDLDSYKLLANQLGLKRISFEGYQNPLSYYKRAKIFMMTSAFEGFPMTLVEALQCGVVPVVMDSFLSLHDIISDGYNGFIVDNDNVEAFVTRMKHLMKGTNIAPFAINGIQSCSSYSVKAIVDEWNKLFSLLKK